MAATSLSAPPLAPAAPRSDLRPDGLRIGQVSDGLRRWRKFKSGFVSGLCMVCAAIVVAPLALVFGYLVVKGAGSINLAFFTQLPAPHGQIGGGVAQAIVGSFVLVAMASLVGLPTGILGALYVTEYAGPRFASIVRFASDVLNGVPSIVWGIVVYAILVLPNGSSFSFWRFSTWTFNPLHWHLPPHGSIFSVGYYSAIAGAFALAFIMIPLVLRTSEEVLLLVPNGYREAALALGIARRKIVLHIVFKTALKGILTGALLAVARVSGETAPLLFTTLGNLGWSHGLENPMAALPLQIYTYAVSPYPDDNRQAWAAALVLLLLVLTLNVGLRYLTRTRSTRDGKPSDKNPAAAVRAAASAAVTGGAGVTAPAGA